MQLTNEQKTKIRDIISDRRTYVKIVADLPPNHKDLAFFMSLANVEGNRLPEAEVKKVTNEVLSCGRPRETCFINPVFERIFLDLIPEDDIKNALSA